jgi:hypothetical protein|tara:strand:+ start:677 stop:838 length:162 start_codon:yes stop_codon:yes gene_type:complete
MAKKIDGAKVRKRQQAMRAKSINKRPSGRTFDGISRPSTNLYRENFDRIFGKK